MVLVGEQLHHDRAAGIERAAGEQIPQRHTQGIDIGPRVRMLCVECLLWSHVVDGPHDLSSAGQLVLLGTGRIQPRQSHVENLDRTATVEQQIGGFDISMHDALRMRVLQPTSRLQYATDGFLDRERSLLFNEY